MSAKTQLEGLVKWISKLTAAQPASTPGSLWRQDWKSIERNLVEATEKYEQARKALHGEEPAFHAEFAEDLERQAEGLRRRANLLAQRAPRRADKKRKKKSKKPSQEPSEGAPEGTPGQTPQGTLQATAEETPSEDKPEDPPDELLRNAQRTVGTAHGKLAVKNPDAAVKAFEGELDVLAEMTLSLRAQLGPLKDEPGDTEVDA